MINLILFTIGFLLAAIGTSTFGMQFIAGVDLLQYWLWFVAGLTTLAGVVIVAVSSIGAKYLAEDLRLKIPFLSAIGGGFLGGMLAALILSISYFQLWLSYFIIDGIPKTANSFSDFPMNTQYAIYAFIAVMVIGTIRSIRFKTKV